MIGYWCANDEVEKYWREAVSGADEMFRIDLKDLAPAQAALQPNDVILLHIHPNGISTPERLNPLREAFLRQRFVLFADRPSDTQAKAFLKLGVYGYCNTYMDPELLGIVIQAVSKGQVWVGWDLMQSLIETTPVLNNTEQSRLDLGELTRREREICDLVASGESNKRIATELDISERTVKNHLRSIFSKTGCTDRLKLAIQYKSSRAQ